MALSLLFLFMFVSPQMASDLERGLSGQQRTISGKVLDEAGEALPGATASHVQGARIYVQANSLFVISNNRYPRYHLAHQGKKLKQYHTVDLQLQEGWNLKFIPRFLLIDKEFNIINAYAPRPSDSETETLLKSLLD